MYATEDKKRNRVSGTPKKFESVLSKPFEKWNEVETVAAEFLPNWTNTQRSFVIRYLIQFLELKVVMEEYKPDQLLAPTRVIDKAWQALALETRLYRRVIHAIQDFHGRPHRMIHYSLRLFDQTAGAERLKRTQSLFKVYFNDNMPTSLDEIGASDASLMDASALTDALGFWNFQENHQNTIPGCIGKTRGGAREAGNCVSACVWYQCANDTLFNNILFWGRRKSGKNTDTDSETPSASTPSNPPLHMS